MSGCAVAGTHRPGHHLLLTLGCPINSPVSTAPRLRGLTARLARGGWREIGAALRVGAAGWDILDVGRSRGSMLAQATRPSSFDWEAEL